MDKRIEMQWLWEKGYYEKNEKDKNFGFDFAFNVNFSRKCYGCGE